MAIIEVKDLTKEYRLGQLVNLKDSLKKIFLNSKNQSDSKNKQFKALDSLNFKIEQGEVVGIIGTNGAGKSTLLKILSGITTPTQGNVYVDAKVAPLIEVGAGLVPDLTGRENIYLNGTILGMKRSEIKAKFDDIVEFAELEEFVDTPIKRYSSGMQVRLGFSIATSIDADLLIVDEVLAVGDLAFQRKCFDRMENMIKRQGKTVLLVSHNIRQIERMCDRVLLLDHGNILMDDKASKVCNVFYENNDKKIRLQAKSSQSNIRSTGEVELKDFYFQDVLTGNKTETVQYNSDVDVVLKLKLNKPLKKPIIVFGVHSTDFVYITTTTSGEELRSLELDTGEYEFTFRIKQLPLLPRTYSARISIDVEEPVKNVFFGENMFQFSIVAGQDFQRTSPENEGFFKLETQWQQPEKAGL